MDFKAFIQVNNLKQKEVAAYLGITESAVSNLVKGKAQPSRANLIKLMNNTEGWDTSMLTEPSVSISQSGHNNVVGDNVKINSGERHVPTIAEIMEQLMKDRDFMKAVLDAQTRTIDAQTKLIEAQRALIEEFGLQKVTIKQ